MDDDNDSDDNDNDDDDDDDNDDDDDDDDDVLMCTVSLCISWLKSSQIKNQSKKSLVLHFKYQQW